MPDAASLLSRLFRLESTGPHWGLDGIRSLLSWCGSPHSRFPSVVVGGTNGKGSTAAALARMLRESGFRTALYTSPHLVRFEERIRVDGRRIDGRRLAELLGRFVPRAESRRHSFFEVATAMAFRHFADARVDIAVLEVGLGGRLDCTNVVDPEVSVLSGLGLEHMEILGRTLEAIAREKAGICRRGRAAITGGRGRARLLLERAASRRGARIVRAQRRAGLVLRGMSLRSGMRLSEREGRTLRSPLLGEHQVSNLECALAAARELAARGFKVTPAAERRALAAVRWPARFEWLPSQRVVLDVAHNPAAAAAFASTWDRVMSRRGVCVLGMLSDKDAAGVGRKLRRCVRQFVVTQPDTPRALPAGELARALGRAPKVVEPRVPGAVRRALAERRAGEPVIVIGSLYTVGEAMRTLHHHVPARI